MGLSDCVRNEITFGRDISHGAITERGATATEAKQQLKNSFAAGGEGGRGGRSKKSFVTTRIVCSQKGGATAEGGMITPGFTVSSIFGDFRVSWSASFFTCQSNKGIFFIPTKYYASGRNKATPKKSRD